MNLSSAQLVRIQACLDPTRLRILEALSRAPGSGTSLARRLGLSQPRVHYHLARLLAAGMIRLAETRVKRGTIEKLYTAARDAMPQTTLSGFCDALSREAPDPEEELTAELHTLRLTHREARHLHEDILRRVRALQARSGGPGGEWRVAWALVPRRG